MESGQAPLLWVYDGIRHLELSLADGRAVIGLSWERQAWTLFPVQREGGSGRPSWKLGVGENSAEPGGWP